MAEPKIAAGVGVSANVFAKGAAGKSLEQEIQKAMEQAVIDASAEGLRVDADAAQIRERMMAARQKVLDESSGGAKAG